MSRKSKQVKLLLLFPFLILLQSELLCLFVFSLVIPGKRADFDARNWTIPQMRLLGPLVGQLLEKPRGDVCGSCTD